MKMKVLFLTHYFYPHIGGVEKHAAEVSRNLARRGYKVTVLTEKYSSELKNAETIGGIKIVRFSYPHIKFFGLLSVWIWLWKNRDIIYDNDIVHCHDIFIWYLPFCLIFPKKPVFATIHGLEMDFPLRKMSIFQKRLAKKLCRGTIGVGKFLEKYLGLTFDKITYGAAEQQRSSAKKAAKRMVYVGRLEEDTGLLKFLAWLKNKKYKVDFCGDGSLRKECEKYGVFHGFTDPKAFYRKVQYCVPGGYLAALEALSFGCELKLFWNNKLREDYWKMSPFVRKDVKTWAKEQTWDRLTNEYLNLYNGIK